jgi:hypothetical protein
MSEPTGPHIFEADFAPGEVVYHKLGEERGIVTGVTFNGYGCCYTVTWGESRTEGQHYGYELSRTPNYAAVEGND